MWKHEYLLELVGVVGARYHHVVVVVYIRLKAISIMPTPSVEYTTGKRGKDNALVDGQRYTLNRKRNGTDSHEDLLDLCCSWLCGSIVLYFYDSYTFYLNEIICFSSILKVELKKSKESRYKINLSLYSVVII